MRGILSLVVTLVLAAASACYDPVHLDAVASLGEEVAGVPRGPTHRAGQPCTTCHGGDGPGDPEFAVAGTIYAVRGGTQPFEGAVVTIVDAAGQTRTVRSNQVGNFYIERSQWSPVFPLHVEVEGGGARRVMVTTIGRDGGCGSCHRGGGDSSFVPGVYLREQ